MHIKKLCRMRPNLLDVRLFRCLLNFQSTDYLAFVNLKIPDLANNTRKHVLATEPPLKAVQREGSNKRSGS